MGACFHAPIIPYRGGYGIGDGLEFGGSKTSPDHMPGTRSGKDPSGSREGMAGEDRSLARRPQERAATLDGWKRFCGDQ